MVAEGVAVIVTADVEAIMAPVALVGIMIGAE